MCRSILRRSRAGQSQRAAPQLSIRLRHHRERHCAHLERDGVQSGREDVNVQTLCPGSGLLLLNSPKVGLLLFMATIVVLLLVLTIRTMFTS